MRNTFPMLWTMIVLVGCGGRASRVEEPRERVTSTKVRDEVDASVYQKFSTSELGTDRTRGFAKTIEWARIGTELGTTYCMGVAVVDQIQRQDAADYYGVVVRLKETRNQVAHLEWRIQFYSATGEALVGFREGWKSIVIEPLGYESVTDSCRLRGAIGFRLFVRLAGTQDEGLPDGFGRGRP